MRQKMLNTSILIANRFSQPKQGQEPLGVLTLTPLTTSPPLALARGV